MKTLEQVLLASDVCVMRKKVDLYFHDSAVMKLLS